MRYNLFNAVHSRALTRYEAPFWLWAGLVGMTLAVVILYGVLANGITAVQYRIRDLDTSLKRDENELANNQALLLSMTPRDEGAAIGSNHISLEDIGSHFSYLYTDSIFVDASHPQP